MSVSELDLFPMQNSSCFPEEIQQLQSHTTQPVEKFLTLVEFLNVSLIDLHWYVTIEQF